MNTSNIEKVTVIQHSDEKIYILTMKELMNLGQLHETFTKVKSILPKNSKFVCIPSQCLFSQLTLKNLISVRNMIDEYIKDRFDIKLPKMRCLTAEEVEAKQRMYRSISTIIEGENFNDIPMCDMTPEEKEEYNRIIHNLYKSTGINIFDLADKDEE